MTSRLPVSVVNGFAAVALMASAAAYATNEGAPPSHRPPENRPPAHRPPAPAPAPAPVTATGTGVAGADARAVGSGVAGADARAVTGPVDARAATGPVDARAVNGDLTAQQQLEAQQRQQAELNARQQTEVGQHARTGDQATTVDASDRSTRVTKITAPVQVAGVAGSFLVPPQVMQQCGVFDAKDNGGWGFGVQYEDKSFGLHYKGKTTSILKTDMDCLKAVHLHNSRMQNRQFQHEIDLQAAREGVELAKLIVGTGVPGQMVVIQKYFGEEARKVAEPGSDVQKLFGLMAPKPPAPAPAPAPAARRAGPPAAAKATNSLTINATGDAAVEMAKRLADCKAKVACPAPGPVAAPAPAKAASGPN